MAQMNMIEAIRSALDVTMGKDPNVVVLGEDVGYFGGVFRCTDGLQRKYGEHRVIDAPIAEGGIIAAAIGMGVNGMRPVAEIQFGDNDGRRTVNASRWKVGRDGIASEDCIALPVKGDPPRLLVQIPTDIGTIRQTASIRCDLGHKQVIAVSQGLIGRIATLENAAGKLLLERTWGRGKSH